MTLNLRSLQTTTYQYISQPQSWSTSLVSGAGAVVTVVFFALISLTGYLAYQVYFKGITQIEKIKAPDAPAIVKAALVIEKVVPPHIEEEILDEEENRSPVKKRMTTSKKSP